MLAISIIALVISFNSQAQSYPNQPIRLVIPFAAGGPSDVLARGFSQKLGESLGQPIIIDNKPGAGTNLAADFVAKSKADGYTIFLMMVGTQAINETLYKKLSYNTIKDFSPISLVASSSLMLVANPSVPVKNVADLIAYSKANPGKINFGSSGTGTPLHLGGELFNVQAGTTLNHVPYKGSAQAHLDIIAGNVQIMFDTTSSAMGQIKAGKFKPLAVTTSQRTAELPNVPTLAEAGVTGFEMSTWYGVFVTAGTPPDVVTRLQTELARIIKLPDVQAKLKGLGGEPGNISPEDFSKLNRQEFERFGKLIKQANIKMN